MKGGSTSLGGAGAGSAEQGEMPDSKRYYISAGCLLAPENLAERGYAWQMNLALGGIGQIREDRR